MLDEVTPERTFDVSHASSRFRGLAKGRRTLDRAGSFMLLAMGLFALGFGLWDYPRVLWYVAVVLGIFLNGVGILSLRSDTTLHGRAVVGLTLRQDVFVLRYLDGSSRTVRWLGPKTHLTAVPVLAFKPRLVRIYFPGGGPLVMTEEVWRAFRTVAESAGLKAEFEPGESGGEDQEECDVRFVHRSPR